MRLHLPLFSVLLCLLAGSLHAAEGMTALQAARLLPKEAWPRLARVEAFEGGPAPERWHLLVHDTREESGLHEYVVAHGEVVASRGVSQFAEELKAEDIIGVDAVKIDSDRAATIAKQYAEANKLLMTSYNYELKKDGDGAVPLWKVTCLDAQGDELGQVLVTATKGNVLRHEGFVLEPPALDAKQQLALAEAQYKREIQAYREKQARKASAATGRPSAPPVQISNAPPPGTAGPVVQERFVRPGDRPIPRAQEVVPEERPGLFQRAGSSVGRIFGGGR